MLHKQCNIQHLLHIWGRWHFFLTVCERQGIMNCVQLQNTVVTLHILTENYFPVPGWAWTTNLSVNSRMRWPIAPQRQTIQNNNQKNLCLYYYYTTSIFRSISFSISRSLISNVTEWREISSPFVLPHGKAVQLQSAPSLWVFRGVLQPKTLHVGGHFVIFPATAFT